MSNYLRNATPNQLDTLFRSLVERAGSGGPCPGWKAIKAQHPAIYRALDRIRAEAKRRRRSGLWNVA